MPPRIRGSSCPPQQLLTYLEPSPVTSSSLVPSASTLAVPVHRPCLASASSPCGTTASGNRAFSTTPAPQMTRLRRKFWEFIKKNDDLRQPRAGQGPTYLSSLVKTRNGEVHDNMPFPENPHFTSQPVLSEYARERIWNDVMVRGLPLKAVSALYNVDMRRVAAVVRMKEIEKRWEREAKPLALPYARAVQGMLPRAHLGATDAPFEPINDIHVHSYTMQQLFVPTSESRAFTRADAAQAFGDRILPPDAKMRIPELVDMERRLASAGGEVSPEQAREEFVEAAARSERLLAERRREREARAEERRVRVDSGRFEFRFEKINAEDVGPTGRKRKAVGWRYGVPFMDRRRGEVKIPTRVE